jgi:thymidylate kinase
MASMLITVSGIVGSGKSTIVQRLMASLESAGQPAHELRFQSLACFTWCKPRFRKGRARTNPPKPANADQGPSRWRGYELRRLSAGIAAGYVARVVMFRLYRLTWRSGDWYISNRYFYDSFVHYRLTAPAERFWYAIIRKLLPVPDLAILATASVETISTRRPAYSPEYLFAVSRGYDRLRADFPALLEVRTDDGDAASDALGALLTWRLSR